MQLTNASSPLMPIPPASSSLAPIPQNGITHPSLVQKQAQLKEQADQFAAVLYSEMFTEMREAGKNNDDDDQDSLFGGGDTDMFMTLLDQKVGQTFSKQSGTGLADSLYKQLAGRLDAEQGGGK